MMMMIQDSDLFLQLDISTDFPADVSPDHLMSSDDSAGNEENFSSFRCDNWNECG